MKSLQTVVERLGRQIERQPQIATENRPYPKLNRRAVQGKPIMSWSTVFVSLP